MWFSYSAYLAYLDSPAWWTKRDQAKQRAISKFGEPLCERCVSQLGSQGHHRTYYFWRIGYDFGEEPLDSILWCCRDCHRWLHRDKTGATYDPAATLSLADLALKVKAFDPYRRAQST
jgi:hypothetical protein